MARLRTEKLSKAKQDQTLVDVFLHNGIRLTGKIIDFDEESVLISSPKPGLEEGILIERPSIATFQRSVKRDHERN